MSLTKQKQIHEGGLRARCPLVGSVLTALHRGAQLAFAIECQHWQVHHGCPLLSTDKNGTILSKCDRRESVWRSRGDCNTACNVIQYD